MDIYITNSVEEGIAAFATGGQANAVILDSSYNIVDTVASALDSVKCDEALEGKVKQIFNNDVNDMNLFPAIGERFKNGTTLMTIDDPIVIAGGNSIRLVCYSDGVWRF